MAEPNPDDGLVPDISELYKRNPTEWHRVAKERARSEATMEKLEEMESLLDRECSTNNNNSLQESIVTGNVNNEGPQQTSKVDSKAALSSVELKNVDYERDSKRSKLSSRR